MVVLTAVGAAAVGVGAWVAAPLVTMARRGSAEEQTVASWQDEGDRAAAVSRARRRATLVASIPAPRGPVHDQRRSPLVS